MSKRFFADIYKRLPALKIDTVFDVGANVGQTVEVLSHAFPEAQIYSFEPVISTFSQLTKNTSASPNVRCFNLALGSRDGNVRMTANPLSVNNSIASGGSDEVSDSTETVRIMTGARFCRKEGVKQISLLKIDTEGHDLDVLSGFISMIQQHRVSLIQVEAGMNPHNKKHVAFGQFVGLLEPLGYALFGIYDQVAEPRHYPFLRRANPVFVSGRISLLAAK